MTRHKNLSLHAEIAINEIRDTRRVENAWRIAAVDDDQPSVPDCPLSSPQSRRKNPVMVQQNV